MTKRRTYTKEFELEEEGEQKKAFPEKGNVRDAERPLLPPPAPRRICRHRAPGTFTDTR